MSAPTDAVKLFTPGPLSTTAAVKEAMLRDLGSRDVAFTECVRSIRADLLTLGGMSAHEWTCVPMQGCGTMGVEATIGTLLPRPSPSSTSVMVVLRNGSYGVRMGQIAERLGARVVTYDVPEGRSVDPDALETFLAATKESLANEGAQVALFGMIHSETSTGLMNPIHRITPVVRRALGPNVIVLVDAMSSFGGVVLPAPAASWADVADAVVSSSNKCVQGVPGFSFALVRRALLADCAGRARSYTLDLHAQAKALDASGQFPFTPPTHALLAFRRALDELVAEGGVAARAARYEANAQVLIGGLKRLGFRLFLDAPPGDEQFGSIIISVHSPTVVRARSDVAVTKAWDFQAFYDNLSRHGCVIYPGKASKADTFRVGCIGDLHTADMERCLAAMESVFAGLDWHIAA